MTRFVPMATLSALGLVITACADSPTHNASQTTTAIPAPPNYATADVNLSTPTNTAYSMMIAMYRGDTEMVDQIFTEGGTLNRLRASGEIDRDGLPRWRDWVGTLQVGQADEELFDIKVEQFGKLATVWAPFAIRFDGEIVGCGVNQFTMADTSESGSDSEWRIVSGIDVQALREECAGFREGYKSGA